MVSRFGILKLRAALPLAAAVLASAASAGGVGTMKTLSSSLAVQAAVAAVGRCEKMGFHVSATVVDPSGIVLATVRGDGAAPHTVSTSVRKAYTAASTHMPTSRLVKIVTSDPGAQALRDVEGFLVLSGGLPIKSGNDVVGAIGVSGSPGPDSDEQCGGAGLASIAASLGK